MDLAQFWFQAPAGGGGAVIGNSLRFRGAEFLGRTPAAAGNRRTFTFSAWVKRANLAATCFLMTQGPNPGSWDAIRFDSNDRLAVRFNNDANVVDTVTLFRDPSAWYHIVVAVDTTQATAANRVKIYINNQQEAIQTAGYPSQNQDLAFSSNVVSRVGNPTWNTSEGLRGYLTETHFVDGQALAATDFGEFNADGVWVPKKVSGLTYGTNGFYLDFSDAADIGADRSGNGNNFTPTGFELTDTTSILYDWMADSPTNNHSTWNPLSNSTLTSYLGANLTAQRKTGTTFGASGSSIEVPDNAKTYVEVEVGSVVGGSVTNYAGVGTHEYNRNNSNQTGVNTVGNATYFETGQIYVDGALLRTESALPDNGVIGMAIDRTATPNTVQFSVDGVDKGAAVSLSTPIKYVFGYTREVSSVFGNVIIRTGGLPLRFGPPAGFEPLSTAELPAVAITNPSEHFTTILGPGPGTGSTVPVGVQYRTTQANDSPADIYRDEVYGKPATDLGATTGLHPMFEWASQLSLEGRDDWYIPAHNEIEIIYRNLKPTTDANNTSSGANANAVPAATGNYTSSVPGQTAATAFQSGGAEAFITTDWYWTSTEGPSGATGARTRKFADGNQVLLNKNDNHYARAIRRVAFTGSEPAIGAAYEGGFFAGLIDAKATPDGTATHALIVAPKNGGEYGVGTGILDIAQRTFPNGLWWIKDRANSNQHQLVDSVRGGNLAIVTPQETTEAAYVAPAGNSVAWCWNLVPDRSNGFDIVTYTGNNGTQDISHNLGVAPEFMIVCNRNRGAAAHRVYHIDQGPTKVGELNSSSAFYADTTWNNTAPTSSVFSLGSSSMNQAFDYVAYLWHSVPGYSSIGSYVGNGNADGPMIYTGFRPAVVCCKVYSRSGYGWEIMDSARDAYNPVSKTLAANLADNEGVDTRMDIVSNGFKLRTDANVVNQSGQSYIYMAFAEHCFGGSNVSPAPAR